jgi:arylsulfatase A-like enzyme
MKKTLLLLAVLATCPLLNAAGSAKPNIVLILADDMGYSDLGCFGSEIPTPNLDALAAGGLRLTQFYNSARCSPTRAALLTGLNPQQAGMGHLAEEAIGFTAAHPAGYLGYLNDHCLTLAEVLRPAGYHNYMAGKWHVGMRDESKWPLQRGFDRYYGILAGATSYLRPTGQRGLTLQNQQLPPPTSADYYTTDAFTDFAIKAVRENKPDEPFFLYLAFNAPHWPLQANPDDIAKFVGKYRGGWDRLRAERHAKQIQLGIVSQDWALSTRDPGARAWDALTEEQQTQLDYRMAVYAAQVYRLDWNVGRLIATLRERAQLENTLFIFLSDNGACAEPYTDLGGGKQSQINDPSVMGPISYGQGWANLSDTPFRRFKSHLQEGGIAAPFIVHWPAGLKTKPGAINATPGYLTDIMPTLMAVSGATYPKEFKGQKTTPLVGRSLLPVLSGDSLPPRPLYWEQYGFKAIRVGDLKAEFSPSELYDHRENDRWELYNLATDRTELHDLSSAQPENLKKLIAQWDAWAARNQVFPAPSPGPRTKGAKKTPPPLSEE